MFLHYRTWAVQLMQFHSRDISRPSLSVKSNFLSVPFLSYNIQRLYKHTIRNSDECFLYFPCNIDQITSVQFNPGMLFRMYVISIALSSCHTIYHIESKYDSPFRTFQKSTARNLDISSKYLPLEFQIPMQNYA